MFGKVFYYLWGGDHSAVARILGLFGPFLLALKEMLPDLFVRRAEETLQRLVSCQIELLEGRVPALARENKLGHHYLDHG